MERSSVKAAACDGCKNQILILTLKCQNGAGEGKIHHIVCSQRNRVPRSKQTLFSGAFMSVQPFSFSKNLQDTYPKPSGNRIHNGMCSSK